MNFVIHAVEESNHIFLPGDINEFYWGSAAFLVVMLFMWWKILPIVKKQIAASKEKIKEDLSYAEKVAESAENELMELKSKLGDLSAERERILAEARTNAEQLEIDLKARADEEVIELRRRSELDGELARVQAESDMQQLISDQAFEAAQGVIEKSLTPELQSRLVDSYIESNLKGSG